MAKKIELKYDGTIKVLIDGKFHGWIYDRNGKLSFHTFESSDRIITPEILRMVADQMDAIVSEKPPEVKRGWLASLFCRQGG